MTWQTEYDNIFGIKHYQVCVGKKCSCHKEVKAFIQDLLDRKAREIEKMADVKWLSPPWSPEWSAENYKVEGYRVGVKEIKTEALNILKEE